MEVVCEGCGGIILQHVSVSDQHYTRCTYTMLYVKCIAIKLGGEEDDAEPQGSRLPPAAGFLQWHWLPGADLSLLV